MIHLPRNAAIGLFALLLPFWIAGSTGAQEPGEAQAGADARIVSVEGEVTVHYHDQEEPAPAEDGMPLEAGDKVLTGDGSRAEIGLDGESVIELGPKSRFAVAEPEPESFVFSLDLGSLWGKVQKLLAGGRALRVRTPTAVAAVRGTEFGVELDEEGGTHVGVFEEGQVRVTDALASGQEVLLESNQEVLVPRGPGEWRVNVRRLERFLRHRERVARLRGRAIRLKARWKRLPPEKRHELRHKLFERRRALHRRIQEKRRQLKRSRPARGGRDRGERRHRP